MSPARGPLAHRAPRRAALALSLVLCVLAAPAGPARAQETDCLDDDPDPTYFDKCGPLFTLPPWGDASGWMDESKYSTIQLADLNGDKRDELLARNDQGIEIWWFDTALGQWRPQVDAQDLPQVLTDFRSPHPDEAPATDWTKPEYYSTIQVTQLGGGKTAHLVARFADGIRVYAFKPGPGNGIDGGSWSLVTQGGPFSDADGWNVPSRYMTIRLAAIDSDDPAEVLLIGRGPSGLVGYGWTGGGTGWSTLPVGSGGNDTTFGDATCASPACYSMFRTARMGAASRTLVGRDGYGIELLAFDAGKPGWGLQPGSAKLEAERTGKANAGVFGDFIFSADCPFPGATTFNDCLGTSPYYYASFGTADFDGDGADEVFARGSDGLRVKKLDRAAGTWTVLPTLTDLAGDATDILEDVSRFGEYLSIQAADLDADGRAEVLALWNGTLQVWSYDPAARDWTRWQPPTPLTLKDEWTVRSSRFATIRVGDVDGDGRNDVIARGQSGIRTWFWNRTGTGGWERYAADGYAAFKGGHSGSSGYANAFAAFNDLALFNRAIDKSAKTVRASWTLEREPTAGEMSDLQAALLRFTNCADPPNPGTPLSYAGCARPTNAALAQAGVPMGGDGAPLADFDATDWTWVVNEILAEIASVQAVIEHFGDVDSLNEHTFIAENLTMAAIAGDLQIAGAAGTTTEFNLLGLMAGSTGIAASLAGLAGEPGAIASAGLWVASEIFGMAPSASPTATSDGLQTAWAKLQDTVASLEGEAEKARDTQSQQVRADGKLMTLLAQLRTRGTWAPDVIGMKSAARQAFSLWTYQQLLPSMYSRYAVTGCADVDLVACGDLPDGDYVTGKSKGAATWIGPTKTSKLCWGYADGDGTIFCDYGQNPGTLPDDIGDVVWGGTQPGCMYTPGQASTEWTYDCRLGVPLGKTVAADSPGWTFATTTGAPVIVGGGIDVRVSAVRSTSARRQSVSARRRGASARTPRDRLRALRYRGRTVLPPALRLRRARVVVERTLFEHGGREELARKRSGRKLRSLTLRRVRTGVFRSHGAGGPSVRLELRRGQTGRTRFDLRLRRIRTRDIRALCGVLPPQLSRASRPLELETRVRLRDGDETAKIGARGRWRCTRDRKGEFDGIRLLKGKARAARPGLSVGMKAPRPLPSGSKATVRLTVTNKRRKGKRRIVSSLYGLRITGFGGAQPRTAEIRELRAGRSRVVRLTVPVTPRADGKVCVQVQAAALSARAATTGRCVR